VTKAIFYLHLHSTSRGSNAPNSRPKTSANKFAAKNLIWRRSCSSLGQRKLSAMSLPATEVLKFTRTVFWLYSVYSNLL